MASAQNNEESEQSATENPGNTNTTSEVGGIQRILLTCLSLNNILIVTNVVRQSTASSFVTVPVAPSPSFSPVPLPSSFLQILSARNSPKALEASLGNSNIGERGTGSSLVESNTSANLLNACRRVSSPVPSVAYPPRAILNPASITRARSPFRASPLSHDLHNTSALPSANAQQNAKSQCKGSWTPFTPSPMAYCRFLPASTYTSSPMTYGEMLPAPSYSPSPAYGSSYSLQPIPVGEVANPSVSKSNTLRSSVYPPDSGFMPRYYPPNVHPMHTSVHGPESDPLSYSMEAPVTSHHESIRHNTSHSPENRSRSSSFKARSRSGFTANDPLRWTSSPNFENITEDTTYDDIPTYGPTFTQPHSLYEYPYALPYTQPPSQFPPTSHQSHSSLPAATTQYHTSWPHVICPHQSFPHQQPHSKASGEDQVSTTQTTTRSSFPNSCPATQSDSNGTAADIPLYNYPVHQPLPTRQGSGSMPRPSNTSEGSQPAWMFDETQGAMDPNGPRPQYYPFHDVILPFDLTQTNKKPSIWSRISDYFFWPFHMTMYDNPGKTPQSSSKSLATYSSLASQFLFDSLPRGLYQVFLLFLPALYLGRVALVFEEADLSLPEIKRMVIQTAADGKFSVFMMEKMPQYERLRSTWQSFIDDVMREWKTFNIISVLLLS